MLLSTILIASGLSVLSQVAALALPQGGPGGSPAGSAGPAGWRGPSPDVYRWINATFIHPDPTWPFAKGTLVAWEVQYHVKLDDQGEWVMAAQLASAHDPRLTTLERYNTVRPQGDPSPTNLSAHVGLTVSHKFPRNGWTLSISLFWSEVFSAKGGVFAGYGGIPLLYDDKGASRLVNTSEVSFIFTGTTK